MSLYSHSVPNDGRLMTDHIITDPREVFDTYRGHTNIINNCLDTHQDDIYMESKETDCLRKSKNSVSNFSTKQLSLPIESTIRINQFIGQLRIIYIFKDKTFLVIGPHWPLALFMFLLHAILGIGMIMFVWSISPFIIHSLLFIMMIILTIMMFVSTVLKEPGILLNSEKESVNTINFTERSLSTAHPNTIPKGRDVVIQMINSPTCSVKESLHNSDSTQMITRSSSYLTTNPVQSQQDQENHSEFVESLDDTDSVCSTNSSSSDSSHGYEVIYASNNSIMNSNQYRLSKKKLHDTKPEESYTKKLWCKDCHIFVPKKAEHCKDCEVCIRGYDHHCPWTSKCIGSGNASYFYLWIVCVGLSFIYFVIIVGLEASTHSI